MNYEKSRIYLTSFEEGSLVHRAGFFNENGKRVFKKDGLLPSTVSKVTTLSEDCVEAFAKEKPKSIHQEKWNRMNRKQKIRENLKLLVGHDDFRFEFI